MTDESIGEVKNNLKNYFNYGGYPDIVLGNVNKEWFGNFFNELFNTALLKDISVRFKIENINVLIKGKIQHIIG